jgi:hypothetical protein
VFEPVDQPPEPHATAAGPVAAGGVAVGSPTRPTPSIPPTTATRWTWRPAGTAVGRTGWRGDDGIACSIHPPAAAGAVVAVD